MGINPLTGLDEDDQFIGGGQPAVQPQTVDQDELGSMPSTTQYPDLASFTNDVDTKRKALDNENKQYDTTGAIQGALASLGAAFQGKDSLGAVNTVMAQRAAQRKEKSDALNNWIANKKSEIAMGYQDAKQKREDSKYAMDEDERKRNDDINSNSTQALQEAAMQQGMPERIARGMNGTQLKVMIPIFEKSQAAKNATQARADAIKERNMQFQERMGDKKSAEVDKLAKDFKNDMDADKGRSGNFGIISGKKQAAERMQTLIDAYKDGNLPPAQVEELALGLSSMLAPGGGGSRAQVEALVPHSITGDAQKLKSYLFNEPMGANQQKFVKMMGDTIQREKQTAENQLNQIRAQRLPSHKKYQETDPEGFKSQLQGYNFDLNNLKDGQYIAPPSEEDKEALKWAMQNPNDKRSAEILQRNGVKVGGK